MKKIKHIKQLRGVLRNIITTQDYDEIKNFNTLYNYSSITDMTFLWNIISKKITKKVNWKSVKFPTLDLKNVEIRRYIFSKCPLYEINLINTYNIKEISRGFEETKNLEKLNSLYLDNCENMEQSFEKSNIKELNLYNTGKVKYWNETFNNSKVEEITLDMRSCKNCVAMFLNCKNLKNLNLKNCENIKTKWYFLQGCKNLEYLEMNLTNVEDMSDFINENNDIKYLKLIGLEEYIKKQNLKEGKENINKKIDINKNFCDIFFDKHTKKEIINHYKNNPIPHIELVKNNTTFNIIGDNNSSMRLEKKEKKEKIMNVKKEKKKEKEEKVKSQKEYNIEINL